jgi:pimeloyl-ACP methyl ester carboxylesterase
VTPSLRPALLAILVAAFVAFAPPAVRPSSAASLDWHTCDAFQCATLTVPLDYDHPAGRRIELSVIRQPARSQARRIGSMFINPGGPGGSAIDFLRAWAPSLPSEVRDRFDIITFDPRGVGESTPLECHDDLQKLIALPPSPQTDAEWQEVAAAAKGFADLCAERSDGTLPYLGTANVARDIDRLREALGEDTITYFGYSYGTEIGQVYAALFPDRVRAMVLDGAVDLALSGDQIDFEQALAFETAYDHFLKDCMARACLDVPGDYDTAIQRLLLRARDNPIPSPRADRPASENELLLAIVGSMYGGGWTALGRALQQAFDGDATAMLRIADFYLGRDGDGEYDNSTEMNNAVNCLDHLFSSDLETVKALAAEFAAQAPHFGSALAQGGITCGFWHAIPAPLSVSRAAGTPPIVVIGGTSDPATPYRWAVAVSQELESGVLLTRRGDGHGSYRTGDSCIDSAVNTYLLTLEPPAQGTECGRDRFEPPPLAHPQLPAGAIAGTGAAAAPDPANQPPGAAPAPPPAATPPAPAGSVNYIRIAVVIAAIAALAGSALWALRRT